MWPRLWMCNVSSADVVENRQGEGDAWSNRDEGWEFGRGMVSGGSEPGSRTMPMQAGCTKDASERACVRNWSPRQPKCAGKVGEVESGCSGGEKEREKGEGAWSAKFGQRGGECRTVHTAKSEHQATVDAMHR